MSIRVLDTCIVCMRYYIYTYTCLRAWARMYLTCIGMHIIYRWTNRHRCTVNTCISQCWEIPNISWRSSNGKKPHTIANRILSRQEVSLQQGLYLSLSVLGIWSLALPPFHVFPHHQHHCSQASLRNSTSRTSVEHSFDQTPFQAGHNKVSHLGNLESGAIRCLTTDNWHGCIRLSHFFEARHTPFSRAGWSQTDCWVQSPQSWCTCACCDATIA